MRGPLPIIIQGKLTLHPCLKHMSSYIRGKDILLFNPRLRPRSTVEVHAVSTRNSAPKHKPNQVLGILIINISRHL
jgi:hypothetical protein